MKNLKFCFLLAAMAFLQNVGLHADSITGSLGAMPPTVNFNNTTAFAFYGVNSLASYQPIAGTATTDSANLADFSDLTGSSGTYFSSSNGGAVPFAVTYAGASSVENNSAQ